MKYKKSAENHHTDARYSLLTGSPTVVHVDDDIPAFTLAEENDIGISSSTITYSFLKLELESYDKEGRRLTGNWIWKIWPCTRNSRLPRRRTPIRKNYLGRTDIRSISRQTLLRHLSPFELGGEGIFISLLLSTSSSHCQYSCTGLHSSIAKTARTCSTLLTRSRRQSWRPETLLPYQTTFILACSCGGLLWYRAQLRCMQENSHQVTTKHRYDEKFPCYNIFGSFRNRRLRRTHFYNT